MADTLKKLRGSIFALDLLAEEIMTPPLYTCHAEQSMDEALDLLKKNKLRHLPVVDESQKLQGMVTSHSLLQFGLSPHQPHQNPTWLQSNQVSDFMISPQNPALITVTAKTELRTTAIKMKDSKSSYAAVIDGSNTLLGIITETDFLKLFCSKALIEDYGWSFSPQAQSAFKKIQSAKPQAHDLMSPLRATLKPQDFLYDAKQSMERFGCRHLPIVSKDSQLLGILSQVDILTFLAAFDQDHTLTQPVSRIASHEVFQCDAQDLLEQVCSLMLKHTVGCIPIMSEGKIVGIISERDFTFFFADGI